MPKDLEPRFDSSMVRPARSTPEEVAAFVDKLKNLPAKPDARANILFTLDLTASRNPTLVEARKATAAMFRGLANLPEGRGRAVRVAVKLGYYHAGLCKVGKDWLSDSERLCSVMERLSCEAGGTQIGRLLGYALAETKRTKMSAMVFIGDSYEEEEDELIPLARKLKEASVPLFVFHENRDSLTEERFRRLAAAAGGAYCSFDHSSADVLCELLLNIVIFSSGGHQALRRVGTTNTSEGKALRDALLQLPPPTH